MSARGSRACSVDVSPLSLLLAIAISTFRSTSWHNDKLFFNLLLGNFFLEFVKVAEFFFFVLFCFPLDFGGDHILFCSVSLRVCGSTKVERAARHLINGKCLSFFFSFFFPFYIGLFWHFCLVGNNAPFQPFFSNDTDALLPFMCQSSFSLSCCYC